MKNILGLALGALFGLYIINPVIVYAQQIYIAHPNNAACWTQSAQSGTLAEVNAWKVQATYNNDAPAIIQHICEGNGPYECKLTTPIPMSLQVTPLRIRLDGATVQPDGSLSNWSPLLDSTLSFGNAVPAPLPNSGSNLRIVKLLQQIAKFFKSFFPIHLS